MDNKIKLGLVVFFLVSVGFTMYSYDRADEGVKLLSDDDYKDMETNHIGLVMLGLAPSVESRMPQQNDIDTGIKLRRGDAIYSLIESRTFVTGDYGKTFAVRVA